MLGCLGSERGNNEDMHDAARDQLGMGEDWYLIVTFLPANRQDWAAETGTLKGLHKNKSA